MALSALQKSLLMSFSAGSILFGVSTVPLALFRSLPIEVQVSEQVVFENEVNALAGPYLGITGAVSAALGFGILGLSGWRSSAAKAEHEQEKRSQLENHLLASKAELERVRFSDARLAAEQLDGFLKPQSQTISEPQPMLEKSFWNRTNAKNYEVIASHGYEHPGNGFTNSAPQTAAASDTYQRQSDIASSKEAQNSEPTKLSRGEHSEERLEQEIKSVLGQLNDLVARVESIQGADQAQIAA